MNEEIPAPGLKFRLLAACDSLPTEFENEVCRVIEIGAVDDSYIYFKCEKFEGDDTTALSEEYWIRRPRWKTNTEPEKQKYDWIGHDWYSAARKKRDELMRKMFGIDDSGDEVPDDKA